MKERRTHPRRDVLTEAERTRVGDVFLTHQRFIENVARQHAPGPDHVADIVQHVGIQVCRGLNGFRGESELRTWLYRVTVNAARDYYKRERIQVLRPRQALADTPPVDQVVDPDEVAAHAERVATVRAAIRRIAAAADQATGDRLNVLVLLDLQGLSVEAIAARLGIPEGTVKSRLYRGRRRLKDEIQGPSGEPKP